MTLVLFPTFGSLPGLDAPWTVPAPLPVVPPCGPATIVAAGDDDEEEELGDEEDLSVAQPLADDDSTFDDFDDEFDDDFEEEENDPDWDHPDEGDEPPPPGKSPGKKK